MEVTRKKFIGIALMNILTLYTSIATYVVTNNTIATAITVVAGSIAIIIIWNKDPKK